MSEQPIPDSVGDEGKISSEPTNRDPQLVSAPVSRNGKRRQTRLMVYGVIAIIVLVVIGLVCFYHYQKDHNNEQKLKDAFAAATAANRPGANASANAKTLGSLQAASTLAQTNQQKVELYNDLALSYVSSGNPQEALHYFQLKHQIEPSSAGADALNEAQIYQQLNDNTQAISEYKLAISYVDSDSVMSPSQKSMAVTNDNGLIQSLESTQ